MRGGWLILLALTLAMVVAGCGDHNKLVSPFNDRTSAPPDVLQGQALLENMDNHRDVRVEMEEIKLSLLTDDAGSFALPNEIADGEWTLKASYPYFASVEEKFTIINGMPDADLKPMKLGQLVAFEVQPERSFYTYGETVNITLRVTNVTNAELTISSATSPMTAFAVRHDDQTVVGGLFPGSGVEPQSVTLHAFEVQTFQLNWIIDNPDLQPGQYQIYALLCVSADYPDYYIQDTGGGSELNDSLYAKLTPAEITID